MGSLETYRSKRDFRRTAEPAGARRPARKKAAAGLAYVIHKHDATRLHYDLRLESGGVLMSWAVTRGPSLDPHEKRLAVHVEDHPMEYAPFEGTIPEGEYGGGLVIVWDQGTWEPEGDVEAAMKKGHLSFQLHGDKLTGGWHLVRLKPRRGEKRDNWLLIKADDSAARPGEDILTEAPHSVKSGMTIEEVAGQSDSVWHSNKPAGQAKGKTIATPSATRSRAKTTPAKTVDLPDFVPPMLATLQRQPPAGSEWLHEVKFDGYRIQARLDDGEVRLLTRSGLDWTGKFGAPIVDALARLDCSRCLIDGEIVVLGEDGAASFSRLQNALSEGQGGEMIYYVFDLLHLDGEDLTALPLAERKARLATLLGGAQEGPLRYSEHFHQAGRTMLTHACRMGLEGIVSKRADSSYRGGRGADWVKSKCTMRQEFVIGGYLPSDKTGRGLRSILVGYNENGVLRYAGRVGTGFTTQDGDRLKKRLDSLKVNAAPFEGSPPQSRGAIWVKPELAAEVEFRAWTSDRILRHASFQGLREDKPADEVVKEEPVEVDSPKRKSGRHGDERETGVDLSHPDRVYWPKEGITKRILLDYYDSVWPRMEPFVVNRPLALVRAPDGIDGQRFFQKHASPGMNKAIRTMRDPQGGDEILFIVDFDGLAALVQYGVLEIHVWGARTDAVETPDQIVFDLDPDEGVGIDAVREATSEVRERLEELGLPAFLKTSGGKGFHVVVPVKPSAGWTEVKGFAHDFARALEQAEPERYTATLSKKARTGRIFIDYLRNGRGSTTVVAYSARARPGAAVSMPIEWSRLGSGAPDTYAIGADTLEAALKRADPWEDFFAKARPLRIGKS